MHAHLIEHCSGPIYDRCMVIICAAREDLSRSAIRVATPASPKIGLAIALHKVMSSKEIRLSLNHRHEQPRGLMR